MRGHGACRGDAPYHHAAGLDHCHPLSSGVDTIGAFADVDAHGVSHVLRRVVADSLLWQQTRLARGCGTSPPANGYQLRALAKAYAELRADDALRAAHGLAVALGKSWPQAKAHAAG